MICKQLSNNSLKLLKFTAHTFTTYISLAEFSNCSNQTFHFPFCCLYCTVLVFFVQNTVLPFSIHSALSHHYSSHDSDTYHQWLIDYLHFSIPLRLLSIFTLLLLVVLCTFFSFVHFFIVFANNLVFSYCSSVRFCTTCCKIAFRF